MVKVIRRAVVGLAVSSAVAAGILYAPATQASTSSREAMLVNGNTGKCLTIAGGVSTENNVTALQFTCDDHPSRRWTLRQVPGDNFRIRNVQTNKCLTIAGGVSTENNVEALQFTCDSHPSRAWRVIWTKGQVKFD